MTCEGSVPFCHHRGLENQSSPENIPWFIRAPVPFIWVKQHKKPIIPTLFYICDKKNLWSIYRIKQAILKLTNLSCCQRNTHGLNSFLLSRNFKSQCFEIDYESNSYSLKKHHIFKFQCLLFHCTTACCWICKNDFCKKGFIENLFYVLTVQQQQRKNQYHYETICWNAIDSGDYIQQSMFSFDRHASWKHLIF